MYSCALWIWKQFINWEGSASYQQIEIIFFPLETCDDIIAGSLMTTLETGCPVLIDKGRCFGWRNALYFNEESLTRDSKAFCHEEP